MTKRNHQTNNPLSAKRWTTTFSKPKRLENRKRLATLPPTFNSDEVVETAIPARPVSDSGTTARLPVPSPSYKTGDPPIEHGQPYSPQQAINVQPQRRPKVPKDNSWLKGAALLISFAMVLGGFIAVFAGQLPESQTARKSTAAKSIDTSPFQSTASATTNLVVASTTSQPTAAPTVDIPLPTETLVEQTHQKQKIERIAQVHQKAGIQLTGNLQQEDVNKDQEVQTADRNEPQLTDKAEADALIARVIATLGGPIENVDDATAKDIPLPDVPPAVTPIARPDLKKPIKIVGIQKLNADELRAILQTKTASLELLQSEKEFANTKNFIREREAYDPAKFLFKQTQAIREQAIQTGVDPKTLQKMTLKLQQQLVAQANKPEKEHNPAELLNDRLSDRKDLQALPLTMGDQCRSNAEEANAIKLVSSKLGRLISEASGGARGVLLRNSGNIGLRIKMIKNRQEKAIEELRTLVNSESHPQYLKTTDQILQAQHRQDRLELINTLKDTDNDIAINLLAKRAKYDLSSTVRMAATNALAEFPRDQYRAELLAGLKYPWHVVAQHSAEALVRLDDKEVVPELVKMLDLPHPNAPVEVELDKYVQPTLVAINHMRNCLLCHAPSLSPNDIATGVVPNWDSPIPVQYYSSSNPEFVSVRADITYLKQDFSVVQPVEDHGPWPDKQRFDYVVQQTPLKRSKVKRAKHKIAKTKNLNREAIVYALQKLTNQSPDDNSSESWKEILAAQNAARLAQADNR